MGILNRFTDIMSANVNTFVTNLESKNADKLLQKYIQDAKNNLGQVKSETAALAAEEMQLNRKITQLTEDINKMSSYAVAAVNAGNDDEARTFLAQKSKLTAEKEEVEKSYVASTENTQKMKAMTKKLMDDITEAESKLKELQMKLSMAKSREKMNKLNEKMGSSNMMGKFDTLSSSIEKRLDEAEAMASLNEELDGKDKDLENLMKKYDTNGSAGGSSVDDELAKLKAELGK